MLSNNIITIILFLGGLVVVRFGLPLLVMALIKLGCCRLLHLRPQ